MKIILILLSSYMMLFSLTLLESIDIAVKNSPKVSISKSNVKYSEYVKDEALSAYHPQIDAGFSWQKLEKPTTFSFTPTHNYSLSMKYNLFNGFSDFATINSKKHELESAKLENISIVADLKLSVIKVYTEYLKAKKSIKTQSEQLISLTKQYDDTNVRYEQGLVAKNELLLIDVEKLKSEQSLTKSKSDFIVAKSNLENIIAMRINENESIDDFDASVQEVKDIDFLQEKMMKNRSELKAIIYQSKSILNQRDALRGEYLPKVNLEATHQINDKERLSGTSVFQPENQTTYGVNVSWNLYSGFSSEAKKKALLEKDNQVNYQLHQLKLDLKNQLIKAYQDFKVLKSAKDVASRTQESAQENYRITSDRYSYGDVDSLTLLVAQSNLTQAVNRNNDAYYDLFLAYKTLQRIVSE